MTIYEEIFDKPSVSFLCSHCFKEMEDRETVVTHHKGPWIIRHYHTNCAVLKRLITRDDVTQNLGYIADLLEKLRLKRSKEKQIEFIITIKKSKHH